MMRMTSSGTEATMSALRLARAVTGREKVIKFAGAYHGHVDGLLAEAGSGLATQGIPSSPGVPAGVAAATVVVDWNAADELPVTEEVAAIVLEPVPANMGVVPPRAGFLEGLRRQADEHGALLIFDEVITGFRVARGGAQERYGVLPDLTIMGKIVGGGLPAAAYGGSRELMERIAPAGDVYQAGTLSGNPLAVAAALATLHQLDEAAYARLAATTQALADGLGEAAAQAGCEVEVQSVPGLLTVFFSSLAGAVLRRRQALRHRRLRRVLPGAAGARRVPAALAVRGVVPVAGARPRARDADGGRRRVRRSRRSRPGEERSRRQAGAPSGAARRERQPPPRRCAPTASSGARETNGPARLRSPPTVPAPRAAPASTSCCSR